MATLSNRASSSFWTWVRKFGLQSPQTRLKQLCRANTRGANIYLGTFMAGISIIKAEPISRRPGLILWCGLNTWCRKLVCIFCVFPSCPSRCRLDGTAGGTAPGIMQQPKDKVIAAPTYLKLQHRNLFVAKCTWEVIILRRCRCTHTNQTHLVNSCTSPLGGESFLYTSSDVSL